VLNERHGDPKRLNRVGMDDSRIAARLRLFGLLALLVPLFAGLQFIVREGVPRVEVRLVAQDVETTAPVEVQVDHVVERVVYVPVERSDMLPPDNEFEPARGSMQAAPSVNGEPDVEAGDAPPAEVADREPLGPAPGVVVVAEPASDLPPLTGTVALAPPIAAPVAAPRVAPVIAVVAAPPEDVEMLADAEVDEPMGEASDDQAVAEAPEEGVMTEDGPRVAVFVSEAPVVREDDGPSIAMLRHELTVMAPKPDPAVERVADEPALEAMDVDAAPEAVVDGDAATEERIAEPEEAVAESEEPVGEVSTPSTEELFAQAETVRSDVVDPGSNGNSVIAVLEHQLIARPAGAEKVAQSDDSQPARELEGTQVVAASDVDEPAAMALDESSGEAVEEVAELVDHELAEVAIVADGPADGDEPEQ
jgi:hypothetical protein